jgi:DNA repair exonuclease SbcCD ATPase subunit
MKALKFHSAEATNFLCFGPDGIKLNFSKQGNVVFVRGENRDVKPIDNDLPSDETRISSNGTGKSTLQEILCWTLYGKTVKSPTKIRSDQVIHNLIGKGCRTEVVVDKYRIERGRKPNFLRLWESDKHEWTDATEITTGDMRDTQKKIEDIIGLSYEAFTNICVFSDDQSSCFLECDTTMKRQIVENLLSLSVYRNRHETAKNDLKALKTNIQSLAREFEIMGGTKKDAERRLEQAIQKEKDWVAAKLTEAAKMVELIKLKSKELQNSDTGAALLAYQTAQEEIRTLAPEIESLETKLEGNKKVMSSYKVKEGAVRDDAKTISDKFSESQRAIKDLQNKIKEKEAYVAKLNAMSVGTRCDKCMGVIDEANYEHVCKDVGKEIDDFKTKINTEMAAMLAIQKEVAAVKLKQDAIKKAIADGEEKISKGDEKLRSLRNKMVAASQVREPKADSAELLLQQQIEELKERAKAKKAEAQGVTPFVDIIANDRAELDKAIKVCDEKEAEVKEAEKLLPYYSYWMTAYGDNGIRKWVIDGIIPALNSRVAYWLQFLIDNKITITFDNQLNETIERNPPDGDPYIYHAMSAGQRRRINLAVSQAFAHIMMISTGTVPSLVFLDEVTTNIDPLGVQGIYNMIGELAEEKQVFITTHDSDLIRMLQGADVISLRHEQGITKMVAG